jgi:hypothetical protein
VWARGQDVANQQPTKNTGNIYSLGTIDPIDDIKVYILTLFQSLIFAVERTDSAMVYKDVFSFIISRLDCNESISKFIVKPFALPNVHTHWNYFGYLKNYLITHDSYNIISFFYILFTYAF